jgi:adenylate kinase
MIVALTGTPGTGKSSVAEELRKRGYRVDSVNELADKFGCIVGIEDDVRIVDVEKLADRIEPLRAEGLIIVEGHLSHLLNPDMTIVLRCHPEKLKKRLESRGWRKDKVLENLEAEIVDSILMEAMGNRKLYEIDATDLTPQELADVIEEILKDREEYKDRYKPGKIDWIMEVGDRIEKFMRF